MGNVRGDATTVHSILCLAWQSPLSNLPLIVDISDKRQVKTGQRSCPEGDKNVKCGQKLIAGLIEHTCLVAVADRTHLMNAFGRLISHR